MAQVFVSSIIRDFEQFRAAARAGITQAGMHPMMVEDGEYFPAQCSSPQQVCLEGIDKSDIFILILASRYGDRTESGLSAVEVEYWQARSSEKIIKIFVHKVDRESDQDEFLTRIGRWEDGHFLIYFHSAEDLTSKIIQSLSTLSERDIRRAKSPLQEGVHDWLVCLKRYTEAQLDRSTMTTPIIGTQPRSEVDKLKSLLARDGKALIIGNSGAGKSGLLNMYIKKELMANLKPVLFINANSLPRSATSIDVVASSMPIQTPLAKVLRQVSQIMGQCYLIVDQLDSAGGTDLGRTLCGFIKELAAFPGVKVVAVSRSYDAKERNEIRTLDFPTVEVKPLTEETVHELLNMLDLKEPSPDLAMLAKNFLNLSLISGLVEKGIIVTDLTNEIALWNRFRESIVERHGLEILAKAVDFSRSSLKMHEWDFALDIAPDDPTTKLISSGILIRSSGERYAFFHEEVRSYLYAWDASMRRKVFPDAICGELNEVEAFGVLRWMHMMYHEEMPEVEPEFVLLLLKPESGFSFYTRAVCLDVLKMQHNPTLEVARILCGSLKSVEAHSRYFFHRLDNPDWFPLLAEQGVFDQSPEPIKTGKGTIIPLWAATEYLIKMASVYPEQVAKMATDIRTDNYWTHDLFIRAAIQMPVRSAVIVSRASIFWLATLNPSLSIHQCGKLVVHLAVQNEWSTALSLSEALTETIVDPVPKSMTDKRYFVVHSRFKHDTYEVEEFIRKQIPELADMRFEEVTDFLEKSLVKAMSLDQSDSKYWHWRHAVEDSPQNMGQRECKDVLIETIRDLLLGWSRHDPDRVAPILEKYIEHTSPIFRRISLYVVQINKQEYAQLAKSLLTHRALLYDIMIHHEYMHLLHNCFELLTSGQKKEMLSWIMKGPEKRRGEAKEKKEQRKRLWIRNHLYMIRDQLSADLTAKLESLQTELGEPEHPDFLIYSSSWWGSDSPLTQSQVEEMTNTELIEFLMSFTSSGTAIHAPTQEGLADTLKAAVLSAPERFAKIAPLLYDKRVKPFYVYSLLNGLRTSWKDGKDFEWDPVLCFCEMLIALPPKNAENILGQNSFGEGLVEWAHIPGEVADLIEEGLRRDEHAIPPVYLPRIREMIFRLLADSHPTIQEEKDMLTGGGRTDAAMLSLNCNRGKALHALFNYALRFARVKKVEGDSIDSFPDGRRMEPEVRKVFDDKLDKMKDPSLAVHSVFGWYLPNLLYLDRQWLEESLSRIFPSDSEDSDYWVAAWDSYVEFVGRLYNELYRLLKPQYMRAIVNMEQRALTVGRERPNEKVAEHLMIAYINDLEKLDDPDGLLLHFYRHAPDHVRGHAVWFLWRVLEEKKPSKGDDLWFKMRNLWQKRIEATTETEESYDIRDELSSYAWWLKGTPESLDDLYVLLESIMPYLEVGTHGRHFLEYLNEQVQVSPTKASSLLLKMASEIPDSIYLSKEEPVRQILEAANRSVEAEAKENVRKIVNIFGERGDYRYRDLLA